MSTNSATDQAMGNVASQVHQPGAGANRVPVVLLLVALADLLFFRHALGFAAGVFGLLVALALLLRPGRRSPADVTVATYPIVVLTALVAAALALVVDTTWVGLGLLAATLLLLAARPAARRIPDLEAWVERTASLLVILPVRMLLDLLDHSFTQDDTGHGRVRRFAGGVLSRLAVWLIPMWITSAFLALLGYANPVLQAGVNALLGQLGELMTALAQLPEPARVGFWLVAAATLWGLLNGRDEVGPQSEGFIGGIRDAVPRGELLSTAVLLRSMLLLNLLFAIQNTLDVLYLGGGRALPSGLSFAAYAHRGAYPLVGTALLAAVLVLVTYRPGGLASRSALARGLVLLWLGQNIALTLSAAWRLQLYVDAYGLSRLRLAAALWMLLVGAGLFFILVRIAASRSNGWLLRVNLAALVSVLYFAAFVDLDGAIAWHNVRVACAQDGAAAPAGITPTSRREIDLAYLQELGHPALPALDWLASHHPQERRRPEARRRADALRRGLDSQLSDWRGYTLRRARIDAAIAAPAGN